MKNATKRLMILTLVLSFTINLTFASSTFSKDDKKVIKERTFKLLKAKK